VKRFTFPLETVLNWRSTQLRMENAQLQALEHERASIQRMAAALRDSRHNAAAEIAGAERTNGAELASLAAFEKQIRRRVLALEERARECAARIEKQKQRVMAADRAKQLLEKIREERLAEWTYESNRELEATAGDLYLSGWKKRRR
jgi:flagellar export protein FliJ